MCGVAVLRRSSRSRCATLTNETLNVRAHRFHPVFSLLRLDSDLIDAQIERLNSEIKRLKLRIERLNQQIERLNLRVERLNSKNERLDSKFYPTHVTDIEASFPGKAP